MPNRWLSALERRNARERFLKVRIAERQYMSQLGSVGRNIGSIIKGFAAKGTILDSSGLSDALGAYSRLLFPWARAVADRMLRDVGTRDLAAWRHLTTAIGSQLYKDLREAPVGTLHAQMMEEQVRLITSLPIDASRRVHTLTREALVTGRRAEEIAKDILDSGGVSVNRARLIARTEVGRTASKYVEVRARFVGSTSYVWHGVRDADERKEHLALEGKIIEWDNPPIAGTGRGGVPQRYHAGAGPNCRCHPSPILPDL
jgi:SPP1 gp7 family putative phage head morphogenesis protein